MLLRENYHHGRVFSISLESPNAKLFFIWLTQDYKDLLSTLSIIQRAFQFSEHPFPFVCVCVCVCVWKRCAIQFFYFVILEKKMLTVWIMIPVVGTELIKNLMYTYSWSYPP